MFLTLEFSSVDVLRMEYRSKFLNPKWTAAMLEQGSGGAYEVSQRMTAMVGWAATAEGESLEYCLFCGASMSRYSSHLIVYIASN